MFRSLINICCLPILALASLGGGVVRTITKTPMLRRMACKATANSMKQWEAANLKEFDRAKQGSSAIDSALFRATTTEVAKFNGEQAIVAFNDFDKFFDTIHIQYPIVEAAMALHQHPAPRVVQAEGFSSVPLQVFVSILAGDMHSVAFTRNYLLTDISSIVQDHPQVVNDVCVDDTSMFSCGK